MSDVLIRCGKCKQQLLNKIESEALMNLPDTIKASATMKTLEEHVAESDCDATLEDHVKLEDGEIAKVFRQVFVAEDVIKELQRITDKILDPERPPDKIMATSIASLIMGLDIAYTTGFNVKAATQMAINMHIDMLRRRKQAASAALEEKYKNGLLIENAEVPTEKKDMS